MNELLQQALAPVLQDLRTSGIAAPRIEEDDSWSDPDLPTVMLWSSDGSGMGVHVMPADRASERIASLADQVRSVEKSLARPEVLVVTTSDALRDDSQADALRAACEESETGPAVDGRGAPPRTSFPAPSRHVIVAATKPLTCDQLPPLSD